MDENKSRQIAGRVRIIALIALIAGMAGIFYGEYRGVVSITLYRVLIIVLLLLFWAAVDLLIPYLTGSLRGLPEKQIQGYRYYALLDLVGYAGLAWFGISIEGNTAIYGALVFAAATMYKKRFYNQYRGISEDDEDEDEEAAPAAGPEELIEEAAAAGPEELTKEASAGPEELTEEAQTSGSDDGDIDGDNSKDTL